MFPPPVYPPMSHANNAQQNPITANQPQLMTTGTNNHLNHSFPGAGPWPGAQQHQINPNSIPPPPPPGPQHGNSYPQFQPPQGNFPTPPTSSLAAGQMGSHQWNPTPHQPPGPPPPLGNGPLGPHGRPTSTASGDLNQSLPLPYKGQAQYTHQVHHARSLSSKTDLSSGASSMKSSPVSTPLIDACEGQFVARQGFNNSPQHQYNQGPPQPLPPPSMTAFPNGPPPPQTSTNGVRNLPPPPPPSSQQQQFPAPPLSSYQQGMPPPSVTLPSQHRPPAPPMPPTSNAYSNQPPPPVTLAPQHGSPAPPMPPTSNAYSNQPPPPVTLTSQHRPPAPPMPPTSNAYSNQPPPPQGTRPGMMPLPPPPPTSQSVAFNSGGEAPRYPTSQPNYPPANNQWSGSGLDNSFNNMQLGSVAMVNLMKTKNLFPPEGIDPPKPEFRHNKNQANCHPDVVRSTLNAIPQTSNLLNKCRLPLGLLLHPFRDLTNLPVIQSNVIVRCRSCRTYINPFVTFPDSRRWKCNVCFRQNELPDEFQYDPVSRVYGEPQRRPEIRSATVEFIAPTEYMLRPPQPAVYVFLMDVSRNAVQTNYLTMLCRNLVDLLDRLPGDSRTQIGFITYDSGLYFYKLNGDIPRMMICKDIEDVFLPDHDGLLVNLSENKEAIKDLLTNLSRTFMDNEDNGNCLGSALQASYKLVCPTGGRVTVFNTSLPNMGGGALKLRQSNSQTSSADKTTTANLGPANDFYKTFALECSGQQIAVDLFQLGPTESDLATITGVAKYSSGGTYHYPGFSPTPSDRSSPRFHRVTTDRERFRRDLTRYLTRKIGFEAVMRVRCTRGIGIQAFHGNFFVRSTDLLSLPNMNPDAGFAMHLALEESLNDLTVACFQAAILYTSSKGERRIRVHTLCVPLTSQIDEVFRCADHEAIAALLGKMAADRVVNSGLSSAREALINAAVDPISAYGNACVSSANRLGGLTVPYHLRLLPLLVLGLLRSRALRVGETTSLDDRVAGMEKLKNLPVGHLMALIYPRLYPVHTIPGGLEDAVNGDAASESQKGDDDDDESQDDDDSAEVIEVIEEVHLPQLHLTAQTVDRAGVYLLDNCDHLVLLVGGYASPELCRALFGVERWSEVMEGPTDLPPISSHASKCLRNFIRLLQYERPIGTGLTVVRNENLVRQYFLTCLIEDRTESTMSYQEFLQYLQKSVKYS